MLAETLKRNIPLYVGHRVIVLSEDGTRQEGNLAYDRNQTGIMLGEEFYSFEDINDVRYLGTVTDYHTKDNTATIDGVFGFAVTENSELYHKLFYKEYTCSVSCHLMLDGQKSRIVAEDVILEGCSHVLHELSLLNKKFLYKVQGSWRTGTLVKAEGGSGHHIELEDGTYVTGEEVTDITRCPKINETVSVVTKQGERYQGIVSVVNDTEWYLVYCDAEGGAIFSERIVLGDLEEVRFQGMITNIPMASGGGTQYNNIDRVHAYKPEYIRNNSKGLFGNVLKNRNASYLVGVNTSGLIAKEIELENFEVQWKYGIVLKINSNFKEGDSVGAFYIGSRIDMTKDNKGTTLALLANTHGKIDSVFGKKLSVVKYVLEEGKNKVIQGNTLQWIAWMEQAYCCDIQKSDYEIAVDEKTGELTKTSIYQKMADDAVGRYYRGKEAEVQYRVVLEDGQTVSRKGYGVLSIQNAGEEEGALSQLIIESKDGTETKTVVPLETIEHIWLYGIITAYNEEQGYIGQVYFHIHDSVAMDGIVEVGADVLYELGMSGKGDGFCAYNVAYRARKQEVFIVAYENNQYTVVDAAHPYVGEPQTIYFTKNGYVNDYFDSERMYLATVTYERKLGREMVVSVTLDGSSKPNVYRKGQIQMFDAKGPYGPYGYVVAWENRSIAQSERKEKNLDKKFSGKLLKESVRATMNTFTNVYDVLYKCNELDGRVDKLVLLATRDKRATSSGTNILSGYREYVVAPVKGESIAYRKLKSAEVQLGICKSIDEDGKVTLENGITVNMDEDAVWRFGVVTGLDFAEGNAYLNNKVRFSMSCMDSTLANVLRTDKKATLVAYEVAAEQDRDGKGKYKIVRVAQVPKEIVEHIRWTKARVLDSGRVGIEKTVTVETVKEKKEDKSERYVHYLTVSSDQMVNKMVKTGSLKKDTVVFIKGLRVPDWGQVEKTSSASVKAVAADIHCEQEKLQMVIRTGEEGKAVLKFCRHATDAGVEVAESDETLLTEAKKGKENNMVPEKTVIFKVAEDGVSFVAVLEKGEVVKNLSDTDLIGFAEWDDEEENSRKDPLSDLNKRIRDFVEEEQDVCAEEYTFILHTLLQCKIDVEKNIYRLFVSAVSNKAELLKKAEVGSFVLQERLRELFTLGGQVDAAQFLCCAIAMDSESFELLAKERERWFGSEVSEKLYTGLREELVPDCSEDVDNEGLWARIVNMRITYNLDLNDLKKRFNDSVSSNELLSEKRLLDKLVSPDKLWGRTDKERLADFKSIAEKFDRLQEGEERRETLKGYHEDLLTWEDAVKKHPTQVVTEVLLASGVVGAYKERMEDILFDGAMPPKLMFGFMEDRMIFCEQSYLTFYMGNMERVGKQTLRDVTDISVTISINYSNAEKDAKDLYTAPPIFVKSLSQTKDDRSNLFVIRLDKLPIRSEGNYKAAVRVSYKDSGAYKRTRLPKQYFEFKVESDESQLNYLNVAKRAGIEDLYTPGKALDSNSPLFKGRKGDIDKLWKGLESNTISFVYGQKRSGKTSLVGQLYSADGKLIEKQADGTVKEHHNTVVAYVDCRGISCTGFPYVIRKKILFQLATKATERLTELSPESKEYIALESFGKKYGKAILPDFPKTDYVDKFNDIISVFEDIGYKIYVVLDEFTDYCADLLRMNKESYTDDFEFLKALQDAGIGLIVIGHERLLQMLRRLQQSNGLVVKNETIKVDVLSRTDAKNVIIQPMDTLGYNPYGMKCGTDCGMECGTEFRTECGTDWGIQLVEYILKLSGCNPYFLSVLCKEICGYLATHKVKYVSKSDLEKILKENLLNPAKKKDNDDTFDSLLCETQDKQIVKAQLKAYLSAVAKGGSGIITKNAVIGELKDKWVTAEGEPGAVPEELIVKEIEGIHQMLVKRGVIWEDNQKIEGEVVINIFVELLEAYLRMFEVKSVFDEMLDEGGL